MILDQIAKGGKVALARALAQLERAPQGEASLALLDEAWRRPRAQVIGVTGPPGVGKSTAVGAMIKALRQAGQSVAVIAVDPSSRHSGGALLGDRLRLASDPADQALFIRSMAARDRLGGLAHETVAAAVLMRALFDRVVIETVGVGQSETDVARIADCVVFCVQPGSGDTIQFMKSGIMEIPDVIAVTKADSGLGVRRSLADLRQAVADFSPRRREGAVQVLAVSAVSGDGMAELMEAVGKHFMQFSAEALAEKRRLQAEEWLKETLRDSHGREGLRRLAAALRLDPRASPFTRLGELLRQLG